METFEIKFKLINKTSECAERQNVVDMFPKNERNTSIVLVCQL